MNARRAAPLTLAVSLILVPVLVGFVGLACGGSPPPPAAAPAQVAKAVDASPPDLSTVDEPGSLIFVGRVGKPSELLKVAAGWTHLPMPGSKVATEALIGEAAGELLDIDQPIDIAVAGEPAHHDFSPTWAAAGALKSIDAARSALSVRYKLVAGENGALLVQGLGAGADADSDKTPRACELAPAAGAAPFRLVCGSSESALHTLGPYLTRAAPRVALGSDIHVEVRFEPLKPLVALGRTMLPAMLDKLLDVRKSNNAAAADLIESAAGEVADLVTDLDRFTVDAKVQDAAAQFDTQATFKTASAVTARIMTGHADRVDVPPSSFWRLPADSDMAFFNRGIDTKEIEHPRDLVLAVLDHALEEEALPEADRKAVLEALRHLVTSPAPIVFAKGFDGPAVAQAVAAFDSAKDESGRDQAARNATEQALGWWLLGLDESAARAQSTAHELVLAWNRPAVQKLMKKDNARKTPVLRVAPLEAAWKLPKDATHVELTIFPEPPLAGHDTAKKAPPRLEPPIKVHALIVPDAGRVWVAAGMNAGLAAAKVASVLSTAPAVPTLATRAGLESMKTARVSSAGFFTMRGLLAGPLVVARMRRHSGSDPLRVLGQLSDQGVTPMTFSGAAVPGSNAAPAGSAVGTWVLPKSVVEAMVRLALEARTF